ncbi:hypothetical protein HLH36_11895 [Gluconacetobacter aggeris]|uniref:Uncharacterized protein n=1 Tax=Gluconacetobacter aggeris TaxID=1286186 RepID=A0A7W4IU90_9PROT|nr:hypothetical protein [Gluconacetobacter aggeris]MBB2169053.1 hypothetical protein [Gluconacetobacter aggeris]
MSDISPPDGRGRPVGPPHDGSEGQWPFFRMWMVVAMAAAGRPASGAPAASYFMPPAPTMAVPRNGAPDGLRAGQGGVKAGIGGAGGSGYDVTAPAFSPPPRAPGVPGHVGPFAIEQGNASPVPMETGRTVTAAYPVKGVPGMDLTINMFAGHRQTNTGSNVGTGALTAGMRIKW